MYLLILGRDRQRETINYFEFFELQFYKPQLTIQILFPIAQIYSFPRILSAKSLENSIHR